MKIVNRLSRLQAVAGVLAASLSGICCGSEQTETAALRVKHVFVIVLENKDYKETFLTSTQDPYLRSTITNTC